MSLAASVSLVLCHDFRKPHWALSVECSALNVEVPSRFHETVFTNDHRWKRKKAVVPDVLGPLGPTIFVEIRASSREVAVLALRELRRPAKRRGVGLVLCHGFRKPHRVLSVECSSLYFEVPSRFHETVFTNDHRWKRRKSCGSRRFRSVRTDNICRNPNQ